MSYQDIISIEPGKRGGRPCIRHMRIAVADVLGWLAAGQTHQQIIDDFPDLTAEEGLEMSRYNPKSPEDRHEEQDEDDFLNGTTPQKSGTSNPHR